MDFVELYVAALLLLLGLAGGGIALVVRSTFDAELGTWLRDGVVTDAQARELALRHGSAAAEVRRRRMAVWEAIGVLAVVALAALYAFAPEHAGSHDYSNRLTWYPLLFTAALVLLTVGAIVAGFVNDEPWLTSAAVVFATIKRRGRHMQEGTARRYENAVSGRRLYADVALDSNGKARLDKLVIR